MILPFCIKENTIILIILKFFLLLKGITEQKSYEIILPIFFGTAKGMIIM